MKSCPTCHSTYPSDFAVCPRDATTLVEVGVWSEGTVVRGKYRILGKLGQGGMAVVYKALHVRFDELRALKAMTPELASDQTFVKRFMHEAVITRKLQHPNAVRVEDIDEAEDGRPFIVMEYIEGQSLKEVIQQQAPLPVARVCSIAKQVAAALDAAHRLGMVHRDIKPANIVLLNSSSDRGPLRPLAQDSTPRPLSPNSGPRPLGGEGGRRPGEGANRTIAKVLDFGIAKIKEAHLEESRLRLTTLTGTGMVVGTPAYMSPEQAMGKRGEELDGRSDLYSLGVVMYQMLTGELPLKADSELQMLMAQINTRPHDLRMRRPDVPEAITGLVMRCLEKAPAARPASGQALLEEIEYWEEEPARLARAQAEQERLARERAEAKRIEREKAEQERLAREMAEANARIKAEREERARQAAGAEPTRLYSEANKPAPPAPANAVLAVGATSVFSGQQPSPSGPAQAEAVPARPTPVQVPSAPVPKQTRAGLWLAAAFGVLVLVSGVWFLSRGSRVATAAGAGTPSSSANQIEDLTDLKPQGYVNDFASVLSPDARAKLTSICSELDQKTNSQIAVVTIHTLRGRVLEDFSRQLANKWGVGPKTNRGVLILLVVDDHRWRVEVGLGLESALPDDKISRLGNAMVPALRQADYDSALIELTSALASAIGQASAVTPEPTSPATQSTGSLEAAQKADVQKQVKAWVALADVDADGGVYGEAIALYQKAQNADPEYPGLKGKLDHAKKAKAALDSLGH